MIQFIEQAFQTTATNPTSGCRAETVAAAAYGIGHNNMPSAIMQVNTKYPETNSGPQVKLRTP
jgi:hypothetical protein